MWSQCSTACFCVKEHLEMISPCPWSSIIFLLMLRLLCGFHLYKLLKEKFSQNSARWALCVLFTVYLKFMNNYRRKARFDFSKCKSSWGAARGLCWATQMRRGEQRATKSRGVTHFINCVGFSSCPLEKSVGLIKLLHTLGGGSHRK